MAKTRSVRAPSSSRSLPHAPTAPAASPSGATGATSPAATTAPALPIDPLLRTALSRLARDHAKTVFVNHPYVLDLIRVDEDGFLRELQTQLTGGRFVPHPSRHASTPKA